MIVEKGYAKINVALEVVNKREDGFHNLSMIMTTIDLYDELFFEDNQESKQITIECDKLNIPVEDNLIYKAIKTLKDLYRIDKGVKVKLIKRIPERAGLGGGSADAAATLRAMNQLWNLGLSLEQLSKIGAAIGSDIPFCIYNKTAKVSGRGEVIEFIDDIPFAYLVLIFPYFKSSTAEVFKNFKIHGLNRGKIDLMVEAIADADLNLISKTMFNDLEYSFRQEEIDKIKNDLILCGANGSLMSGSGSTVYGICVKEKQAQNIALKLRNLYQRERGPFSENQIIVSKIRSFRKAKNYDNHQLYTPHNETSSESFTTKVNGMLMLGYLKFWDNFKILLTQVYNYDNITVHKLKTKKCEVYVNGILENDKLSNNLKRVIEEIGYGLKIEIERKVNRSLGLINNDNYLCAIIVGLKNFNENTDKLFSFYPKRIEAYHSKTFFYDSKEDSFMDLGESVFGYAVIAPLNIKNYQSPRHTIQIEKNIKEMEAIIEGIKLKNYFQMASNIFNGIGKFESRQIRDIKGFPYVETLEKSCLGNGAIGFSLSIDGRCIIALCRYERNANNILNILKEKFNLRDAILTTINSHFSHQSYKNEKLKIEKATEIKELISDDLSLDSDYFNYSLDENNPFDNQVELDDDDFDVITKQKSKYRKKTKDFSRKIVKDVEGLLSIHSGGSIFKQFDFDDIAHYFEKYFHGKSIVFNIEENEIPVRFDVSYLPHILGIHLLDDKDQSLRGKTGFDKLYNGEILFNNFKKTGKVKPDILQTIYEKTQSSVLIFNDIYNDRLYDISCFPNHVVQKENSKMKMLEFVVARKLTTTTYHKQYVIGIGKDPTNNNYFFYTSFLWDVPANVGKKDSYKIGISR